MLWVGVQEKRRGNRRQVRDGQTGGKGEMRSRETEQTDGGLPQEFLMNCVWLELYS